MRRALAQHAGGPETFDAFVAEIGRAIEISPDDPTLVATLLEEGVALAEQTVQTSNLEAGLTILQSMRASLEPAGAIPLAALDEARGSLAAAVLPLEALKEYVPRARTASIDRALAAATLVRVLTTTVGHLPPEARAALWRDLPELGGIAAVRLLGADGTVRLSSRSGEAGSRRPGVGARP